MLEPWNFEWLSMKSWEFHNPNWRTHIFFRGVGQPPTWNIIKYDPICIPGVGKWVCIKIVTVPQISSRLYLGPLRAITGCVFSTTATEFHTASSTKKNSPLTRLLPRWLCGCLSPRCGNTSLSNLWDPPLQRGGVEILKAAKALGWCWWCSLNSSRRMMGLSPNFRYT